ncbi:hypothetical protein [Streptomyces sp. NPDC001833]|uniref:hypothetical protein n=1 Tax=Streptomyces sp. NPDC001833 TaxID=3154658 RepID=UPI00331C1654
MTAHHAVDVTLTRPATLRELQRARRSVPLAVNADHTRLLVVQRAKSPGRALRTVRRRLEAQLPIDVLTTHYQDGNGQILLNVTFSPTVQSAVRHTAAALGQRPRDFVRDAVTTALARRDQERSRHLTVQLESLLTENSAEELLLCAADVLNGARRSRVTSP